MGLWGLWGLGGFEGGEGASPGEVGEVVAVGVCLTLKGDIDVCFVRVFVLKKPEYPFDYI